MSKYYYRDCLIFPEIPILLDFYMQFLVKYFYLILEGI